MLAHQLVAEGLSRRHACQLLHLGRRHSLGPPGAARRAAADAPVLAALRTAVVRHPGWGFWKYHHYLRHKAETATAVVNHQRLLRLYRAEGLHLPQRRKKRLPARVKQPLTVPDGPGICWSMDFTSDALRDGRRFRTFNVIDDFHRAALVLDVDFSLPAERVVRVLDQLVQRHGKPQRLRCDNGPEFIADKLQRFCTRNTIDLAWIEPGKPTQNAYIERFNGSYRRELLDAYIFPTLQHARQLSEQWRQDYNTQRPHQSLGNITPMQFLAAHAST